MAERKTQGMRIVRAYPMIDGSNLGLLPYPGPKCIEYPTQIIGNIIVANEATFITDGVQIGDVVNIGLAGVSCYVTEVISETTIVVSADLSSTYVPAIFIYRPVGPEGCNIMIGYGTFGNALSVKTVGGDIVSFYSVKDQSILPVMITNAYLQDFIVDGVYVII